MGSNSRNTYELKAGANKLEEVNMAFELIDKALAALDTVGQTTGIKTPYKASAGQTVFDSTIGISIGASVFLNGSMLFKGEDYTNDSYTFTLVKPAELDDDVILINAIPLEGIDGASGTFTSNDGKTITVANGIITDIV